MSNFKFMDTTTNTVDELKNKCALLEQQNAELMAKLNWYEEQFRLSQQRRFGSSSEKTNPDQLTLFNEAEFEAKPNLPEPTVETITYSRRKKEKGHRETVLKDLPVETIEYRLTDAEQVCSSCGSALHEMSTEIRQELKVIPPQVKLVKHIRYVYSCRRCEQEEITTPIVTAPMPSPVLSGSLTSPSAMAFIMNQKYVEAMPLYRQEQQLARLGVQLSRQTMANWMLEGADRWLSLLYGRMYHHLLQQEILHADETKLQVLKEPGRKAKQKSYLWLYRTGRESPPIILYEYQSTRAKEHPRNFLAGFKGYLHVDGYAGYHDLPNVTLVGCLAHARRRFDEALKALPPSAKNASVVAKEGLNFCNRLFAIERELHDVTPKESYDHRLKFSRPLLDDFLAWLKSKSPQVLPKSKLGDAVQYCLNQWTKLEAFLLDGRLEIDNNRALSSGLENPQVCAGAA